MHSGGKTIHLQAGHYQAKIVTVGAGLAELTHRGRHIVIPHKPEEMPLAHLGKVLIPWPNRVVDGSYHYNGKDYQLAVNDSVSHTAIHGLLAWRDWQINQQSASEVSLTIFLPPSYGYPFALVSEVIYRLEATRGLQVFIHTQNVGDEIAPHLLQSPDSRDVRCQQQPLFLPIRHDAGAQQQRIIHRRGKLYVVAWTPLMEEGHEVGMSQQMSHRQANIAHR